jgi:hypothetical protein
MPASSDTCQGNQPGQALKAKVISPEALVAGELLVDEAALPELLEVVVVVVLQPTAKVKEIRKANIQLVSVRLFMSVYF